MKRGPGFTLLTPRDGLILQQQLFPIHPSLSIRGTSPEQDTANVIYCNVSWGRGGGGGVYLLLGITNSKFGNFDTCIDLIHRDEESKQPGDQCL